VPIETPFNLGSDNALCRFGGSFDQRHRVGAYKSVERQICLNWFEQVHWAGTFDPRDPADQHFVKTFDPC
jgi:hypothetical protein